MSVGHDPLTSVAQPTLALISAIEWAAVREEAVGLLRQLIQLDTTNPPGRESMAAEFLADTLAADHIPCRLLEATAGRANLVARLTGSGQQAPLLLLGHTDVVYADAGLWRFPPFSGALAEGYVWGRGALDMKGLLIMQIMALKLAKRMDLPLARDLILLATADEEDTGRYGAGWVVDHHWDLVQAESVFSEGGVGVEMNGRVVFLLATAEKGYADLTLTAMGYPSHASTPSPDNALVFLAQAIQRIAQYRSNVQWTEPVEQHVAALASHRPWPEQLALAGLHIPFLAPWLIDRLGIPTLRHALYNTFTPTVAHAGRLANVVPDMAQANLNCRILPGVTLSDLLDEVRQVVHQTPIKVTVRQYNAASASPIQTPFFEAVARAALAETPSASVAPYMMPGATDARFFRSKGATAYGLMPVCLTLEEMSTIHSVDERIKVTHMEQGTRAIFRLICDIAYQP